MIPLITILLFCVWLTAAVEHGPLVGLVAVAVTVIGSLIGTALAWAVSR